MIAGLMVGKCNYKRLRCRLQNAKLAMAHSMKIGICWCCWASQNSKADQALHLVTAVNLNPARHSTQTCSRDISKNIPKISIKGTHGASHTARLLTEVQPRELFVSIADAYRGLFLKPPPKNVLLIEFHVDMLPIKLSSPWRHVSSS